MRLFSIKYIGTALTGCALAGAILSVPAVAQDTLTLTSPAFKSGDALPADLKCQRDDGDGVSPPLAWTGVPAGTQSLALIMYHYPKGTTEGVDPPSQYWLLWNMPVGTTSLPRGNPDSVGTEGSDKDAKATGYTAPCSPKPWLSFNQAPQHHYFIELFALNAPLPLPAHDDVSVNWAAMTTAMKEKVITSSRISFWN